MADGPTPREKKTWFEDSVKVDRIWYGLIALCVATVICDFFYHKHVEFAAEDIIPGMYGWYGFIGCVFLVLTAKLLRSVVGRSADYYDRSGNG